MRYLPGAAVLTLAAALPAAAVAQQPGDITKGVDLALRVCANCHGVAAGETVSPVSAAPSFEDIADAPGMTGMALTAFLRTPHRTMPDLILSPAEIDNVVAYILSLKES